MSGLPCSTYISTEFIGLQLTCSSTELHSYKWFCECCHRFIENIWQQWHNGGLRSLRVRVGQVILAFSQVREIQTLLGEIVLNLHWCIYEFDRNWFLLHIVGMSCTLWGHSNGFAWLYYWKPFSNFTCLHDEHCVWNMLLKTSQVLWEITVNLYCRLTINTSNAVRWNHLLQTGV